jgi:hypothetical protein
LKAQGERHREPDHTVFVVSPRAYAACCSALHRAVTRNRSVRDLDEDAANSNVVRFQGPSKLVTAEGT